MRRLQGISSLLKTTDGWVNDLLLSMREDDGTICYDVSRILQYDELTLMTCYAPFSSIETSYCDDTVLWPTICRTALLYHDGLS